MKATLYCTTALALILGACVGGGDDGDDDVTADAGTGDDGGGTDGGGGPMGNTALGTYNRALPLALEWQGDATLFTVHGEAIDGTTGENVVENNQSFWRITFISESSGLANDVMSYMGNLSTYERPAPDGATLVTQEWTDSDAILAKLAENGFEAPAIGDPLWELAMDVGIFPYIDGFDEPLWKVSKSNLESSSLSEEWLIGWWPAQSSYLICPPDATECQLVP